MLYPFGNGLHQLPGFWAVPVIIDAMSAEATLEIKVITAHADLMRELLAEHPVRFTDDGRWVERTFTATGSASAIAALEVAVERFRFKRLQEDAW